MLTRTFKEGDRVIWRPNNFKEGKPGIVNKHISGNVWSVDMRPHMYGEDTYVFDYHLKLARTISKDTFEQDGVE